MAPQKSINRMNALKTAIPAPTLWSFVIAAGVANLLVATLVLVDFSAIALVTHDARSFQTVFWLVPFVTLVVWSSATVFYVVILAARLLGTLGRRLIGPARSSPSGKSGVWDHWLDSPETRHP